MTGWLAAAVFLALVAIVLAAFAYIGYRDR